MEMRHESVRQGDRDVVLVVSFAGSIAPGSEGGADARSGTEYILRHLSDEHSALVLNLTDLDYAFGDAVGAWFITPRVRRGIPVLIAALGPTAKALMDLLEWNNLGDLLGDPMLYSSPAAALDSLA